MFLGTERVYDIVYSWNDYEREAAILHRLVGRDGGGLLDVACGTGRHLEELARWYRGEGIDLDPEMVAIARRRGSMVHESEMTGFGLGRRFEIVTCLFSSIAYAEDLDAAVANLARHVLPGGALVVEPWLYPDAVLPGHISLHTGERNGVHVARMGTVRVEDRLSHIDFDYLIGESGRIQHRTESHAMRLWTHAEYLAAFERAQVSAGYEADGLMGRGLYLGTRRG